MAGVQAVLLGGRYDHLTVELTRAAEHLEIAGELYRRLDDPDTGEYLGGYVAEDRMLNRTTNPRGGE